MLRAFAHNQEKVYYRGMVRLAPIQFSQHYEIMIQHYKRLNPSLKMMLCLLQ